MSRSKVVTETLSGEGTLTWSIYSVHSLCPNAYRTTFFHISHRELILDVMTHSNMSFLEKISFENSWEMFAVLLYRYMSSLPGIK